MSPKQAKLKARDGVPLNYKTIILQLAAKAAIQMC